MTTQTGNQPVIASGDLLGLDDATVNNAVVPTAELEAAEEGILGINEEPANEVYDVVDMYPEVQLPQSTLTAISTNESLWEIQSKIDYLEAELVTTQNQLRNKMTELQNQAKQELIDAQKAANESLVLSAIEQPEMMSILASVLRIMQQSGKAGILLEALETIENGTATDAMTRLATTVEPVYHTPESPNDNAYVQEPAVTQATAPVVEPIKTTKAPMAKWKP